MKPCGKARGIGIFLINKLSQLKRVRPMSAARDLAEKKATQMDSAFGMAWKRAENIRRGGLVGTIGTAMRNLYSGMIRNPAEGFVNLFETVALRISSGIIHLSYGNVSVSS